VDLRYFVAHYLFLKYIKISQGIIKNELLRLAYLASSFINLEIIYHEVLQLFLFYFQKQLLHYNPISNSYQKTISCFLKTIIYCPKGVK